MVTRKFIDDVILHCCYLIDSLFFSDYFHITWSYDIFAIGKKILEYKKTIYSGTHVYIFLYIYLTLLFCDFNFSLFQRRHKDKDTKVKKLMIFKNILNKKELSLNLIIINITTHFRPNFLCTENILFVRNSRFFFKCNNHPQYWNKMSTIFSILQSIYS